MPPLLRTTRVVYGAVMAQRDTSGPLRRGWTTGACATAATRSALCALLTGTFEDPVTIILPKGERPSFPLASERLGNGWAEAAIVKDAGDDPDVTHGATVRARVSFGGTGVSFRAGKGVGMVTKPGLPVAVGEPAINPVPRAMMRAEVERVCLAHGRRPDVRITIGIDDGETIAARTWHPRLGIVGGLSVLGTTGVVRPFSCAAWIHSIHRGVDVARATNEPRIVAATGSTSEAAALRLRPVPETAVIDMGDFAGGLLKYLRAHPVPRVTIAGGFAKLTKLAQGSLDLHSGRSQVDTDRLAQWVAPALAPLVRDANTAAQVLEIAGPAGIAEEVARRAHAVASDTLRGAAVELEVIVVDRAGEVVAVHG